MFRKLILRHRLMWMAEPAGNAGEGGTSATAADLQPELQPVMLLSRRVSRRMRWRWSVRRDSRLRKRWRI